jgi:DNA-binding NarL/FixJ family response regulator
VEPAGEACDAFGLFPALQRSDPDVVLLDHRIGGELGVLLCRRITRRLLAPAVIIYSAFARDRLTVPALVAGADAVLDKGGPERELVSTIHAVGQGRRRVPEISRVDMLAASSLLSEEDGSLLRLLVRGESAADAAKALSTSVDAVETRVDGMLATLLGVPGPAERATRAC